MLYFWIFCCCISYLMGYFAAAGNVVLIANNVTLSFEDIEANFAPSVRDPGICGTVSIAEPLDACSLLTNGIMSRMNGTRNPFVLIIRGGCSFEHKVRRAQAAGFEAAIVYDNETSDLVAMAGNPVGIDINAVFVSKVAGETLAKYAGAADMQIWVVPSYGEDPSRSIIAISFISLIGVSAVLAAFFILRRHRVRSARPLGPRVREFHGISSRLVKAMPSLIFTAVLEDNCTSQTCAICLEDYNVGEKLRVLPCRHKFHAVCVDTWLTSWRTFCPVCKRDAKTITMNPPPSESTPLLASTTASVSSSLSPPSLESSSALRIVPSSYQSRSVSKPQPFPSILYNHLSLTPHNQSPQLTTNQSSVSHISHSSSSPLSPDGTCVVTSNSPGYTSLSSLNSIYMMPYATSPGHASSTYVGSSSHQPSHLQSFHSH